MDQNLDVVLRDFDGNVLSILFSNEDWAVFRYDETVPERHGAPCPPNAEVPKPGTYILLRPDATPITVSWNTLSARVRHPTISNTPSRTEHYRTRVHARDPCCLISGLPVIRGNYSRFKAVHIFPRAHDIQWTHRGYPSRITDPAPLAENVLLLRSDLHDAWDNYQFGVNPDRGHVVIPFVPGYDDIAGKVLKLDHIGNWDMCPLDDLLCDHFLQGVLKNMKGAGEPTWDHEDALGDGMMDLSRWDIWGGTAGQEHLEYELAHRLHSVLVGVWNASFP
ncbi:uncharacterized protein EI90DRAFT_3052728 [Cantharellus anzutake]|uniref:uncharacterized protein n=1 Tax=Cantharellus anzutake TaxID=1750568 RepID=UPI001905A5F9|nr:uncharacterized protein EI90DRAFT_3052728 [Cantharellus anzutake]KAF8333026.1 hypothetical protein EI90DRAFT_3052728 [Cantharellus anzutake]